MIAPDLSRRCPIVDPDDHHLHVSLGCAVENLAHAALAAGLQAGPDLVVRYGRGPTMPLSMRRPVQAVLV